MSEKQNIVYLMTDQQKASAASFLGNPHVPSPFADRMAEEGIVFENAFAPSSICTPSRASVFTGVHPLVHQVTCHQNRAPQNLPQLSEILKENDYYCCVAGHYELKRNLNRGWHEQANFSESAPLQKAYAMQIAAGRKDVGWSAGALDCGEEGGKAHLLTNRVFRMIDQIEASGSPFFLHVPYDLPHPPYFVPTPFANAVNPEEFELPEVSGNPELKPEWHKLCRADCGSDLATEEDIRRLIAVYYGMISYADLQMKRVFEYLEEKGLMENTWIIISSDHGDYTGEKGLYTKNETLYECLTHVPLIIRPPEAADLSGIERGERVEDLIDLVDLFPTILSLAGIDTPEYVQGSDLLSWLSGDRRPIRDAVFAEVGDYHGYLGTSFPSGMPASGRHPGLLRSIRTKDWSYIHDPDYGDEAYDLRIDPTELDNLLLAEEPEWAEEVRVKLEQWEDECLRLRERLGVIPGDRGFVEGWE